MKRDHFFIPLEELGGDGLTVFYDSVSGTQHGDTSHLRRSRATGTSTETYLACIPLDQTDAVNVNAEPFMSDLCKRRRMALTMRVRTNGDLNVTVPSD